MLFSLELKKPLRLDHLQKKKPNRDRAEFCLNPRPQAIVALLNLTYHKVAFNYFYEAGFNSISLQITLII